MTRSNPDRSSKFVIDKAAVSSRLSHLLQVALAEFAAHGFDHVSIDGIARASGVSKETIYRHFADKAALFEAVVEIRRAEFWAEIETVISNGPVTDRMIGDLALAIYQSAAQGGFLSLTWLRVANHPSTPAIVNRPYGEGFAPLEPIRATLDARLREGGGENVLSMESAADFGAMAVGGVRLPMGWPPLGPRLARRYAEAVAHLFLYGCATGTSNIVVPVQTANKSASVQAAPARTATGTHISKLMEVAREHFYAQGYSAASLDNIAAEARVGRGTLYRHFRGKAGLFDAVMLDAAHQVAADAQAALPDTNPNADPAQVLTAFAKAAYSTLNSDFAIALLRTMIAEAKRVPSLARQVYSTTRLTIALSLAAYLSEGADKGLFCLADADWHAQQFLILATEGNRPLTRGHATTDTAKRQEIATRAVNSFLHGQLQIGRTSI